MNAFFVADIAGLAVGIHHRYPYIRELCEGYVIENNKKTDFSVSADEPMIDREAALDDSRAPRGCVEATCLHRQIAGHLAEYDAFLFHAATISCNGIGYAFTAKSGTGKTTHISLWQKQFGDRVRVINGDKPIIRRINGIFTAFGTPWRGKEMLGENASCPLRAVCFLRRSKENSICRAQADEILPNLFTQIYLPEDETGATRTLDIVDDFIRGTEFYILSCNMESEAAEVAWRGMNTERD